MSALVRRLLKSADYLDKCFPLIAKDLREAANALASEARDSTLRDQTDAASGRDDGSRIGVNWDAAPRKLEWCEKCACYHTPESERVAHGQQ